MERLGGGKDSSSGDVESETFVRKTFVEGDEQLDGP